MQSPACGSSLRTPRLLLPSVYLFRDGKPVYLLESSQIENRTVAPLSEVLKQAFNQHCNG